MNHELTPLCALARHHGTDKGGWHDKLGTCHNYTATYHELFKNRRSFVNAVLEIGILDGASLRMWRDYFPNAFIIGLDNDVSRLLKQDRIHSIHADQGNAQSLKTAMTAAAAHGTDQFDLIVDDGSHVPEHQISSANCLSEYLSPHGVYVIEDIFYDCRPQTILHHIPWGQWSAIPVGIGLGGAHCECGCEGGETLLVGRHVQLNPFR